MEIEKTRKAFGEPMRYNVILSFLERKHYVRSLSKKFEYLQYHSI